MKRNELRFQILQQIFEEKSENNDTEGFSDTLKCMKETLRDIRHESNNNKTKKGNVSENKRVCTVLDLVLLRDRKGSSC